MFKLICLENATCRIKVGTNGSSSDPNTRLAQDWHRGRKVLGCSLASPDITRLKTVRSVAAVSCVFPSATCVC